MDKIRVKNFIYNSIYQLLSLIAPLITMPYVSRILKVEDIGTYSYTNSIVNYFALLAALGTQTYGERQVAYYQNDEYKRTLVLYNVQFLKFIINAFIITTYIVFALRFIPQLQIYFFLQIFTIISVFFDITWFFQGLEKFDNIILKNFIIKIIGTCVIFLLVKKAEDIYIYILTLTLMTMLGNVSLWLYLPKLISKIQWHHINPVKDIKIILELFIPILSIQLYSNIDKTMIGSITKNVVENGYYEQAQKVIRVGQTIMSSLGTILLPYMSALYTTKNFEEIRKNLDKAINFSFFIACPLFIGLFTCSDNLVLFLFGKDYLESIILVKIFSPIILISGFCNVLGNGILIPFNNHNKTTIATIMGAIINIIFNYILINKYASIGAAIASVFAETIVLLLHYLFSKHYISNHVFIYFIKYMSISLLMGIIVKYVNQINLKFHITTNPLFILLQQIVVGILTYFLLLRFFRSFCSISKNRKKT